jgi:hypothetical protein
MYDLNAFEKELLAFSNRVDIIVGLEMGKKLSQDDAYREIKSLYKKLKTSRKIVKNIENEPTN